MVPRRFLSLALALAALGGVAIWVIYGQPVAAQAGCDRFVVGIDAGDTTDCSDEAHPCRTIQYAIDQSAAGDVICVAKNSFAGPLVYAETLTITHSLTLDGAWDARLCRSQQPDVHLHPHPLRSG